MGDAFSWPDDLPRPPDRCVLHWTAGAHIATGDELLHYHILLEHEQGVASDPTDDRVRTLAGVPIANNLRDLSGVQPAHRVGVSGYAAHTRGFNTGSIGLALCGMRGAVDKRPGADLRGTVDPGPSPITQLQLEVAVGLLVQFCRLYSYAPVPERVLTHYEADCELAGGWEPTPLRRWDVTWVPGHDLTRRDSGSWLRGQVRAMMEGRRIAL